MKVSDIMQRSVIRVGPNEPLKDVARIIFSLGVSGVPILDKKKLIGIVTEEDILKQFYPTMRDVIEDYVHTKSFEEMEKNITNLLEIPIKKIMNKQPKTILQNTPIMKAQSLMLLNNFSKLPVVNTSGELVGIISQGDIFREIIKNEMPKIEKEKYAGFIARHYDLMVDWEKRFSYEFPALFNEFRKNDIKSIMDVGSWTGEYSLALAKEGVEKITGFDHNISMIKISEEKLKKLPRQISKNVNFVLTDFTDLNTKVKNKYDALICLGNALPYIPIHASELIKNLTKKLRDKNGVVILQVLNMNKILQEQGRLLSFRIQNSNLAYEKEHMFVEFVDKTEGGKKIIHHIIVFDNDGKNWIFKGITSVPIFNYTKGDIEKALKQNGYKDIRFSGNSGEYQGEYGNLSFSEPFDPQNSDWLNVVAINNK